MFFFGAFCYLVVLSFAEDTDPEVCHYVGSQCIPFTSPLSRAIKVADNRQPFIHRAQQDAKARETLEGLRERFKQPPNIVWLLADDVGFGDVGGPWGGGAHIGAATPYIDDMARNGLALMSAYSQPTCTPTRAAMMTGRLPTRTGLTRPILAGDTVTKKPWADETSIADALRTRGYYTVLSGKWHTGEIEGSRPCDVGYDEFKGYYGAQKEITQHFDERRYPDLLLNPERKKRFLNKNHRIHQYYMTRREDAEGNVVVTEEISLETTSIEQFAEADLAMAEYTVDTIKRLTDERPHQPFFINHNFLRTHADSFASKQFKGKSAAKYQYKDNIVEIDWIVGRVLQALEEAGVADNTFVFFTSDNGPQLDTWPDSGFTPFRGGKSTTWEGGVRVPAIAYWKGVIEPRESAELFDLLDLFNTAIELANATDNDVWCAAAEDKDCYIDGIDQASFLLNSDGHSKREHVYMYAGSAFNAMRMREYKTHMRVTNAESTWEWIDHATSQTVALAPWLYNLFIDPKEQMPLGHRMNPWLATMNQECMLHMATLAEDQYPPKDIGLGM